MSANHTTTATATNITAGLVDNLVPVLQALDMGVISAVQSQGELHAEMERLAAGNSIKLVKCQPSECLVRSS